MQQFKVECGSEHYRIIGPNGEEGPTVEWGDVASIKIGAEIYYCDGNHDADQQMVERVVRSEAQDGKGGRADTSYDEVLFDGETEEEEETPAIGDDEEDEEDEDDEEEEEETVGPQLV